MDDRVVGVAGTSGNDWIRSRVAGQDCCGGKCRKCCRGSVSIDQAGVAGRKCRIRQSGSALFVVCGDRQCRGSDLDGNGCIADVKVARRWQRDL